jgi:mRNA interferase YafQ
MLALISETRFEKDLKLAVKRRRDVEKLYEIVNLLRCGEKLPVKNRNHKLQGSFKNYWECHIEPDWLLIYKKTKTHVILARTGTHADLF